MDRGRIIAIACIMVVIVVISAAFFYLAVPSVRPGGLSGPGWGALQYEEGTVGKDRDVYAMLLGTSNLSTSSLKGLNGKGLNITSSIDPSALSSLEPGSSILFIDGDWYRSADHEELIIAVRPLLSAGIPIFIINGTAGDLKEMLPDADAPWMTSRSPDQVAVRGLKYGDIPMFVDIGGSVSYGCQLSKAVSCAANWGTGYLMPIVYNDTGEEGAHWRIILQYNYYSADLFEPYGKAILRNTYYKWVNDSELASANKDMYMAHYWAMSDPGCSLYDNEWRNSGITVGAELGDSSSPRPDLLRYDPSTAGKTATVNVDLGPPYSWRGLSDPSRWTYEGSGGEVISHSNSAVGLFITTHAYDPASDAGSTELWAEPGAIYRTGLNVPCVLTETHIFQWARPAFLSWDRQDRSATVVGELN